MITFFPLLALAGAATAHAAAINVDINCGGTYAPGDTVPYDALLDEQSGLDHLFDLTVTIDTPVTSHTQVALTIFLFANQTVGVSKPLIKRLPANAAPGLYTVTLKLSGAGKTVTDTCAFDVI